MHILDQTAPGLADKLQSLSPEQRRDILGRACLLASGTINDLEPEIGELLKAISGGNLLSQTQIMQAQSLAEEADEQYFSLQEEDENEQEEDEDAGEPAWLNWFYKARLLTAIATGFGGTSWNDTADAVYELCSTRDEPAEIIALVESEIELRKGMA